MSFLPRQAPLGQSMGNDDAISDAGLAVGGLATEEERFGAKMLRVDILPLEDDGQTITQYYGGSSIYALTITDEETARAFARQHQQRPIDAWSARRMLQIEVKSGSDCVEEDDPFDDCRPI